MKIVWKYCGSISKLSFLFLYIIFHFFLSIIHTFLFFFSWFFSTAHVYPYISILSFFSLLSTWFQNLPLSFFLQLSLPLIFFFFFYLIPKHYPALSVIKNRERGRERKNRRVRWLHSATPSAAPPLLVFLPNAAQMVDGLCLFFFFLFFLFFFFFFFFFFFVVVVVAFIVMVWLILRLCFWVCILIMLEFREVWEKGLLCL